MIYFDNASTTPIYSKALDVMNNVYTGYSGNPSSLYASGVKTKEVLETARSIIANVLNAEPEEIFFTSGGSESNTWAIKGYARLLKKTGRTHIISTPIEHHSVLNTLKDMSDEGFTISFLEVDKDGHISVEQLEDIITEQTGLVSVMYINNEIGSVQPLIPIGEICSKRGIILHTDAVQAVGQTEIDVKHLNISTMSFSGHKFNAPCGIGGLYIRKDMQPISPLIHGGQQEFGVRGGTENVPMALAMAVALDINDKHSVDICDNKESIKRYLYDSLSNIDGVRINGTPIYEMAGGIINASIGGVNGQSLVLALDTLGVCISSGAACYSNSKEPSHVLKAIGMTDEEAINSIRISIGSQNTQEEAEAFIKLLIQAIEMLR